MLTRLIRCEVEKSFEALHDCGVVQQDIHPRHIRHNLGPFRHLFKFYIIDLEDGRWVDEAITMMEQQYLKNLLQGSYGSCVFCFFFRSLTEILSRWSKVRYHSGTWGHEQQDFIDSSTAVWQGRLFEKSERPRRSGDGRLLGSER